MILQNTGCPIQLEHSQYFPFFDDFKYRRFKKSEGISKLSKKRSKILMISKSREV